MDGSPKLPTYEPNRFSPQLTDTTANPALKKLNDKAFLFEKYTAEGSNLEYIAKVSGASRTSIKKQIREAGLERSPTKKLLTGQVPYGWKVRNGQLVKHHGEQDTIALMAKLRTEGRSLREICDALDAAGVKTKRGGSWKPASVMKILRAQSALTPQW